MQGLSVLALIKVGSFIIWSASGYDFFNTRSRRKAVLRRHGNGIILCSLLEE